MPPVGKVRRFGVERSRQKPDCGRIGAFVSGDVTMRWVLLLLAVLGFGLGFSAKAPGLMGLGFVLGFVFLIVAFFAFAAARLAETSRPDSTLLTDKDINALRASMRTRKAANGVDAAAPNHPNPG
jgi:hypothetical protein